MRKLTIFFTILFALFITTNIDAQRSKRKAKARGQSLNAYVENVLVKDTPANLVWPEIVFPADISPETMAITRNYTSFTKEELRKDDRLAYIFGK